MSSACRAECVNRLERVRTSEQVVLYRQRLILTEYGSRLNPSKRPPSPGSAFLKWLLVNQCNPRHSSTIDLTPLDQGKKRFAEFPPDVELEATFDPSDRKFVSAAYIHPDKPPILESADSKWLGWEDALSRHGVRLEVLCRSELVTIRLRKTGGES